MKNQELLFHDEYDSFYTMTEKSNAFKSFCIEAFGKDFSQDGFSDINQVNMILPYIHEGESVRILDIGCGNGKMLRYLRSKTNCSICGFDYSENAIKSAKEYSDENSDYRVGIIGEINYPNESFDVIISMDTMYFSKDMVSFVGQIKSWLKKNGTIFVAYQEGDVMPKTVNEHTTELSEAFRANNLNYEVKDITMQTYEMLKKKRQAAIKYEGEFISEGNKDWFDMLMGQTDCATKGFEDFKEEMARYIYVVRG